MTYACHRHYSQTHVSKIAKIKESNADFTLVGNVANFYCQLCQLLCKGVANSANTLLALVANVIDNSDVRLCKGKGWETAALMCMHINFCVGKRMGGCFVRCFVFVSYSWNG